MKPRLSVALCTYNGEKFIGEQLCSIQKQTILPFEMVICDDNSSDETIMFARSFADNASFQIRLFQNKPGLGVVKNFERAISLCTGDYVALSDQDDVWLPNKLEMALKTMQDAEKKYGRETPILVHSDLIVTDSHCNILSSSFMKSQNIFHPDIDPLKTLLVQNFVTGCTMLINRPLVDLSLPIPDGVIMHDWWIALVAASCGKIVFIPEGSIHYRQHGGNVVGAKKFFSFKNFKRIIELDSLDLSIAKTYQQVVLLLNQYNEKMDKVVKCIIREHLSNLQRGGFFAAIQTKLRGICKQGLLRNTAFLCLMIKGGYKKYLNGDVK